MTFQPLEFEILNTNTINLESKFSTRLGRYKIVDTAPKQASSSAAKKINTLELLILRTQQVIDCKTDRTSARDVFNQLVNELREVLKPNEKTAEERTKDMEESTLFLLGALLHRYFRLIKEYDSSIVTYSFSFFVTQDVKYCRLFQAIRSALGLPKEVDGDYRKRDLTRLDVTTIVTSLEVFQENMLLKDENQIPRFKKYPHFEQDPNFQFYLQNIIDEYKQVGLPILNQFKAINFVTSLAVKLNNEQREIEKALHAWSSILVKDHQDFSLLNREQIESHINAYVNPEPLRDKILDLFNTDYIQKRLASFAHGSFLLAMKSCYATKASYILTGGYALLLQTDAKPPLSDKLTFCMNQALHIVDKPEEFDDTEKLRSIRYLKEYIEQNPDVELDCEFFAGKEPMNTQISESEQSLVNSIRSARELKERTGLHV